VEGYLKSLSAGAKPLSRTDRFALKKAALTSSFSPLRPDRGLSRTRRAGHPGTARKAETAPITYVAACRACRRAGAALFAAGGRPVFVSFRPPKHHELHRV